MLAIRRKIAPIMAVFFGAICLASAFSIRAEFLLEFAHPASSAGNFPGSCHAGNGDQGMCNTAGAAEEFDPDTTPFTQESVSIDGVSYWHQIIGDPEQGFAMETYIQKGVAGFTSDSGGRNSNFSFGLYRGDLDVQSGNGWDPLGLDPSRDHHFTGNGTANPTKVVMRQVLGGEWDATSKAWRCGSAIFCMDFTKASLNEKPRITQAVNDDPVGFSAFFDLDMSNSNYADATTAGTIINTVTLPIALPPSASVPMVGSGNAGNFDNGGSFNMATDTQKSLVTGGRYTYSAGAGWVDTGFDSGYQTWDYDEGTYSYDDGSFDHLGVTWGSYFDQAQNPFPGPGNEGKCDSGAITGSCL